MPSEHKRQHNSQKLTKSQRRDQMARKRDERAARNTYRKDMKQKKLMDSYLADDENYTTFANQLTKLGLHLRDIPGDGYVVIPFLCSIELVRSSAVGGVGAVAGGG